MNWIIENLGTLGVGFAVAAIAGLAVFALFRDRRHGKNLGCSCDYANNCSQCPAFNQHSVCPHAENQHSVCSHAENHSDDSDV